MSEIMVPTHSDWKVFKTQLAEECKFHKTKEGKFVWDCEHDGTYPKTVKLLKDLQMNVLKSIQYFKQQGGHCDCTIVLNCGGGNE